MTIRTRSARAWSGGVPPPWALQRFANAVVQRVRQRRRQGDVAAPS
jgi:hypothetical protein